MGLSAGTVKRQVLEDNRGPAILCEPNESFRKSMEFSDERDSSPAVLPDQEGVSSLAGRASCSAQVSTSAETGSLDLPDATEREAFPPHVGALFHDFGHRILNCGQGNCRLRQEC